MKAISVEANGGPEFLKTVALDDPVPAGDQLLVEVAAAGINYMDIYQREGIGRYKLPTPFVLGAEGAGTVVATNASGFSPGDRVAWASAPASYAEKVVVPAPRAVKIPDEIDLSVAAAVMLQGLTAHYLAVSTFPLKPGDVAVVHAAAGGVGLLLTQIAKKRGAVVVATASTDEKRALAKENGADYAVTYDACQQTVNDITGGAGADVVYDGVGQATFDNSLMCLRTRGCMVLYGAASGQVPPFDVQRLSALGSLFLTRPFLGDYTATKEELEARALDLFAWIKEGSLKVSIGAKYALHDAAQAHRDLESRRTTGKLLLIP